MGRAPCCEKVGLNKGRWTAEEDEILTKYILANGEGSWRSLPKNAGLLRCGKSCRLRWINYLRADLKRGNITKDEEETIVKLHTALGNRWSLIAAHLQGRTDNEIKNYWNSHLRRKIYSFSKHASLSSASINIATLSGFHKSRGGRNGRSAVKKHTSISEAKPKSEAVPEPPSPDNNQTMCLVPESSAGMIENSTSELGKRRMQSSSWRDSGEKVSAEGVVNPRKEGEHEEWGPYEWLDNEINLLKYVLGGGAVDPSGNHIIDPLNNEREENGVLGSREGRGNEVTGPDTMATNDQGRESSSTATTTWSSNAESGELNNCGTSPFDVEWYNLSFDWNSVDDTSIRDGEDEIMSWICGL